MAYPVAGNGRNQWPPKTALAGLTQRERDNLLARGHRRVFESGEPLMSQGDPTTHVMVVLDGYVKITAVDDEGTTTLLAIRMGGDLVGELAAMDGSPRLATVTASGAVTTLVLDQWEFRGFLAAHPEAALTISSSVATKLRRATRKLVDFNGREVRVRVARVLVELSSNYGRHTSAGIELRLSMTQPELAGLVTASEPAVHKALTELRRDGIIATSYRGFVIQDPIALHGLAGMEACSELFPPNP